MKSRKKTQARAKASLSSHAHEKDRERSEGLEERETGEANKERAARGREEREKRDG